MTLTKSDRTAASAALVDAYRTKVAIEPLTDTYPGLDLADAYEIQLIQARKRQSEGARARGHKVGLTSAAMRKQLGVDEPDYGHLFDDMFVAGIEVETQRFLQPRVEPEIAFILNRELRGPGVTLAEAAAAVSFVLPSLELIDSRIVDWRISLRDTIADNASSGGVALGAKPTALGAVDLRLAGCNLSKNGELVDTGTGGAVLGDPLIALVWLANKLAEFDTTLEAGHVVLPGACTASIPAARGDVFTAEFAELGSVTVRFA